MTYVNPEPTGRMVDVGGHREWRYDDEDQPYASTLIVPADHPFAGYVSTAIRPRRDGWTAARQRAFLERLAEDGHVEAAAAAVGLTARSAFRLRAHPKAQAFARGWDAAVMIASQHLLGHAFQRALTGSRREIRRDGKVIAEQTVPSDRMLMFLLRHLRPDLFATDLTSVQRRVRIADIQGGLAEALEGLADVAEDAEHPSPRDLQ